MGFIKEMILHTKKRRLPTNKKISSTFIRENKEKLAYDSYNLSPSTGDFARLESMSELTINPFDLSTPVSNEDYNSNAICFTPLIPNSCQRSLMSETSNDSGYDEERPTESILSFVSRSNADDINMSCDNSDSLLTTECQYLSTELKQASSPVGSYSETGYLLPIVSDMSPNNVLIPQISSMTLANLLSGNHRLTNNISVFDCRYPYEYSGGHIINSTNTYNCQKLLKVLFPVKNEDSRKLEKKINKITKKRNKKLKRDETIYIFYCEFSSFRGPTLAKCLRSLDRLANSGSKDLFIPHIYVLNKGYREFFAEYPQLCNPKSYVTMKENPFSVGKTNILVKNNSRSTYSSGKRNNYKKYEKEMRDSKESLQQILKNRTNDNDILELFLTHPSIEVE